MGEDLLLGELRFHERQDLFGGWDVASDAAEELDGGAALEGEAHIVAKLAGAHFHDSESACASGQVADLSCRERVEGNGPEEAGFDAPGAGLFDDRLENTADD